MISINKRAKSHVKMMQLNRLSPLIATFFIFVIFHHHIHIVSALYSAPCPSSWIHSGHKCYKIAHNPRNFENAKNRCHDLSAQLAYVEDEPNKDEESSSMSYSSHHNGSILAYLSSGNKRPDLQSRYYYVNISSDLLKQHRTRQQQEQENFNGDSFEHMDLDLNLSDLWLPKDDPSVANLTTNATNVNHSFVLAYSRQHAKWGLVPVSPTRKMSFLCERHIDSSPKSHHSEEQPQSPAPTSQNSYEKREMTDSAGARDNRRNLDKQSTTTPQPEVPPSALFREFPHDQSIVLGSTAEMRCSSIESESTLTWTFNGKNLTQSNRVRVHNNGLLRIEHVRNTDEGNYTCTIHSGGIVESKAAYLEIIERPHRPEYITAELLDKQASTSVRIKWTPGFNGNSPIKKYLVEMRTVTNENIDSEIGSIMQSSSWEVAKANISADQTNVIITDLKPARKYIFRVKATNRVGTGDSSLPSRPPIEVPVQPPSMSPENLSGTPKSSTSIAVQWSPPPPDSQNGVIKGYKVRHKLAGYASDNDWYTNDVPDATHLSFILDDLIVWQNYEIQIAAENDKGVGPFSSSIYVRTNEGKPAASPKNVSSEAIGSTIIKINWNPPPPQLINGLNQGYRVQVWQDRSQSQLITETVVPHNTLTPFHTTTIDGLLPYTEYYVTVMCYTNAGNGPPNEEPVVVKTKQDLPEPVPSLEFVEVLDRSLKVIWKPPKRINGELNHYTLEYSEASSDKKILKKFPGSTNQARIVDLTPQTSYLFRIYPHTDVGQGPGTTNRTTTSVPPTLPEPPSGLVTSNVGPYSVTIQFKPGFDGNAVIEQWIAEALTLQVGDYKPRWENIYISTNHTQGDSVVIRNLRPHTHYKIRLTPVNIVGPSRYPSEPSGEFQTMQVEPEQAPKDLSVEDVRSTSAVVHWSPLSNNLWLGNPRGYNLTWAENNNSTVMYKLINETRADSYLVRDLEEYTEYAFRIYAINDAGASPPSEPVYVTTLEDVPSSGPTNLTAHALSSTTISVDWNAIPKRHRNGIIKGFKIQYQAERQNAPLQYKVIEDNSTKHVTLNDLKAFTKYNLAVSAFTSAGEGVYTGVVSARTIEDTPGTPQNLSFPTVSQTVARILWDPPEDTNGDILGYKVTYHALTEGSKEVTSHELHQNERTFKATNLKPDTHYVFTVTAKTKEGWGQQASVLIYTYDSELPFYRESWFVILCASLSVVITIIMTALLFIQTKSYKYKQDAVKSTSQDRLGDAGFSIDDEPTNHYNNGFGMLSSSNQHRRSNGALSQSTANFTLPKTPPRPHPGSVAYSDDGDDDVFEDMVVKPGKSIAGTSHYDCSGDSLTEKPSEISSSPAPESESADDEYVNMANRHFVNHYANVNGTLRSQKSWKKASKPYSSHRTKPKLPQRPVPQVPQVPGDHSQSSSDNGPSQPVPGTSGTKSTSLYGDAQGRSRNQLSIHQPQTNLRNGLDSTDNPGNTEKTDQQNTHQSELLNNHITNLNGGRIIVDNMAGSRAPLPGFTSFVLEK